MTHSRAEECQLAGWDRFGLASPGGELKKRELPITGRSPLNTRNMSTLTAGAPESMRTVAQVERLN